jgi:hypothetical protein
MIENYEYKWEKCSAHHGPSVENDCNDLGARQLRALGDRILVVLLQKFINVSDNSPPSDVLCVVNPIYYKKPLLDRRSGFVFESSEICTAILAFAMFSFHCLLEFQVWIACQQG